MKRNKFKSVVGAGLISLALAGCGTIQMKVLLQMSMPMIH